MARCGWPLGAAIIPLFFNEIDIIQFGDAIAKEKYVECWPNNEGIIAEFCCFIGETETLTGDAIRCRVIS